MRRQQRRLYFPLGVFSLFASLTVFAMTTSGQAFLQPAPKTPLKWVRNPSLVGEYYRGDGLGFNQSLVLAPNGSFEASASGCTGDAGRASGRWAQDGNRVILRVRFVSGDFKNEPLGGLSVSYHDDIALLIPDRDEPDFAKKGASESNCFYRRGELLYR